MMSRAEHRVQAERIAGRPMISAERHLLLGILHAILSLQPPPVPDHPAGEQQEGTTT